MEKIIVNKIRCKKCNEIIENTYKHDFKFCKCGTVAIDGGRNYLRRGGKREDWEELSEYESGMLLERSPVGNGRAPKKSLKSILQMENM